MQGPEKVPGKQLQVKRDLFDRLIKYCYYILRDIQCLAWDRESEQIINMKKRQTLLLMADNIDKVRLNELLGRFDRWSGASRKYLNLKLNAEDFALRVQSLSL